MERSTAALTPACDISFSGRCARRPRCVIAFILEAGSWARRVTSYVVGSSDLVLVVDQ